MNDLALLSSFLALDWNPLTLGTSDPVLDLGWRSEGGQIFARGGLQMPNNPQNQWETWTKMLGLGVFVPTAAPYAMIL